MNEKEKVESTDEVSKEEKAPESKEAPPKSDVPEDIKAEDSPTEDISETADGKADEISEKIEDKKTAPKTEEPLKEIPAEVKEEVKEPAVEKVEVPKEPTVEKKEDPKEEKAPKKSKGSEKKASQDKPKIEARPLIDPLGGFELLSRKDVVELLVKKHSDLRKKYDEELNGLDIKPVEIVKEKDEEKDIRDIINESVQDLKGRRKELKDKNKLLRIEFFDLLNREEKLKGHAKEVKMYSQFSKDLEWKLETEAITIETERRLLDELRETMSKIRSITDGFTPQEIHSRLSEIQEEIGNNLIQIEDCHRQMLEKVGESNLHHGKFVDAKNQIRERESRRGWLKRRIELHVEMEKFWMTQIDQAKKLDSEEVGRDIEKIKAVLLGVFDNRDKSDKDQKGHKEKDHKSPKKEKPSPKQDKKEKKEAPKKPAPDVKKEKEEPKKDPAPSEKKEKKEEKEPVPTEKKEKKEPKKETPPSEKKEKKEEKERVPVEKKDKKEAPKDTAPVEKKEKETPKEPVADIKENEDKKAEEPPISTEKKEGGDV